MLLTQKCKFVKIKYIEVKLNQKYIRRERNIMMKKNGFTLAEVLITLAIIGVVATLTLPALMTNTQEQQAKSALKKGINTLTEAAQMNQAIDGFDYSSLVETSTEDENTQSLYGLLSKRINLDYSKQGLSNKVQPSYRNGSDGASDSNFTVFFRDGATLSFPNAAMSSSVGYGAAPANETQDDGLPYGIPVLYDTNGPKAPNIVSNCNGDAAGNDTDVTQQDDQSLDDVCTKEKRVIKDQFGVRLRGGYAVPNGPAARWAFEN